MKSKCAAFQKSPPTRIIRGSAARTVIEFGDKLRENAELYARVAAIEAQFTAPA